MVGFSSTQGAVAGWEAGAGAALLGASIGTELRPFGDQVAEFYIAAEPAIAVPLEVPDSSTRVPAPFIGLGGSAGFAVDENGAGSHLSGGFAGAAWIMAEDCRERWVPTASISIGVHVFIEDQASEWTLYATPKLGTLGGCPDLRHALGPSQ